MLVPGYACVDYMRGFLCFAVYVVQALACPVPW